MLRLVIRETEFFDPFAHKSIFGTGDIETTEKQVSDAALRRASLGPGNLQESVRPWQSFMMGLRQLKRGDGLGVGLVATLPAAHCVRSLAGRS